MTLLLTDVSTAGIAMISDSLIAWVNPCSGHFTGRKECHQKLFKVDQPLFKCGVSFWGTFGEVPDFEAWLKGKTKNTQAQTVSEFAEELAVSLNKQSGKVVPHPMGIHIAGYGFWSDYSWAPFFYHVHNGHTVGSLVLEGTNKIAIARTGSAHVPDQPRTLEEGRRRNVVAHHKGEAVVTFSETKEDRRPFKAHQDFPDPSETVEKNRETLKAGYLTTNGDYFRVTLRRELEQLISRRDPQAPRPPTPSEEGYIEKQLAWMIHGAELIKRDVATEGEHLRFDGPYQELALESAGFLVARGPHFAQV